MIRVVYQVKVDKFLSSLQLQVPFQAPKISQNIANSAHCPMKMIFFPRFSSLCEVDDEILSALELWCW